MEVPCKVYSRGNKKYNDIWKTKFDYYTELDTGLKKGIKDKEYMYIIGTDVFDQIQCLCLKERDGQF